MSERSIFIAALEKADPAERAAYLDQACADNPPLRQRIERLLKAHELEDSFLQHPAPAPDPRATADEPPLAERPGSIIGPYKLLQQIGEGGMGVVYLAEQEHPVRRRVALKIIKPGMDSKQVLARFAAEQQALALMGHPNIAKVHDAGTTPDGRPYFVMELVKGVPITKYCDELNLPVRDRLALFAPVCHAIQHAHQKGIIHRDVKPSNVLICMQDGQPFAKVIDFGVAKALHQKLTEHTLQTELGAVIGTLEYMAPEQAELSALDVDTRADVYALGVLLYELLTGSTPLDRKRLRSAALTEVLRIIKEEEPPRPSTRLTQSKATLTDLAAHRRTAPAQLTKEVRGELDWIVMKAIDKDRTRRYETASNLGRDVERYLVDQPVEAGPPSALYRLGKFLRRNRTAVRAGAVIAVLAVVVGVLGWLYRGAARDADAAEEKRRKIAEANKQVPLIEKHVGEKKYREAFALLQQVQESLPGDERLPKLREACAVPWSVTSFPSKAAVWCRPYEDADADWELLGETPLKRELPRGLYVWKVTKEGFHDAVGLRASPSAVFVLDRVDKVPAGMVRVLRGTAALPKGRVSEKERKIDLPPFLIDRYEVTNREFLEFVKVGGYSRAEYWKDLPFVGLDGEPATWEQVKPLLVDADGKPGGPATWKDGSYPPGEDSHPVRGVSWYEAAAYARFAGKRLPSIYHWRAASVTGGWAARRSNFGPHLLPVEQLRGVEPFGTFGMFGNVKEWCANEDADGRRFILGGAWDEPEYMAVATTAHAPLAREHNFGFRCMAVLPDKEQPEEAWKLVRIRSWRDFLKEQADGELLDANSFQLIRHRYAYESRDVAAVTLADDDEGPWRHLKVRFDAAYNGADGKPEPLLAHLFLPSHARPPYQVIVYFPGLDAFSREHIKPLAREFRADELVRSGRALLYPVYKGTLERRRKALANLREHEELLIQMGQDLRRSLDYLKQRGDVDMDRLGYYGLSLGASNAHFLAVEDRFRAAVLMAGGMLNLRPPREYPLLDRTHYYPHINPKLPVLMVNGTLDTIFPVKESQIPLFKLLGSQIKEHYLQKGYGHSANEAALRKAVEWFDRHLGKPALRSTGDSP